MYVGADGLEAATYYAMAAFDGRLCRFDADGLACYASDSDAGGLALKEDAPNAGAVRRHAARLGAKLGAKLLFALALGDGDDGPDEDAVVPRGDEALALQQDLVARRHSPARVLLRVDARDALGAVRGHKLRATIVGGAAQVLGQAGNALPNVEGNHCWWRGTSCGCGRQCAAKRCGQPLFAARNKLRARAAVRLGRGAGARGAARRGGARRGAARRRRGAISGAVRRGAARRGSAR